MDIKKTFNDIKWLRTKPFKRYIITYIEKLNIEYYNSHTYYLNNNQKVIFEYMPNHNILMVNNIITQYILLEYDVGYNDLEKYLQEFFDVDTMQYLDSERLINNYEIRRSTR